MYCRYCGKQISDDAKFCEACGKSQFDSNFVNQEKNNNMTPLYSKPFLLSVFSIILNVTALILSFTKIFKINISLFDNIYSNSIQFGIFDLFKCRNLLSSFSYSDELIDELSIYLGLWGLGLCLVLLVYLIFILEYLVNTFKKYRNKKQPDLYISFSLIPICLLVIISTIGMCLATAKLYNFGSISPSVTLIAIYIIGVVQLVINIFFSTNKKYIF